MDFKSLFRFFLHCQEKIRLSTFPDEETKYCIVSFKESNSTKKQDALLSLFCFFPVNVVFFLLSDFLFQLHRQHLPLMPEISNRKPYIQSMHVFFLSSTSTHPSTNQNITTFTLLTLLFSSSPLSLSISIRLHCKRTLGFISIPKKTKQPKSKDFTDRCFELVRKKVES